jgi:ABC-type oligopeptide transport system substrate-binding subunit
MLVLDTRRPPFASLSARQAVRDALDLTRIAGSIEGSSQVPLGRAVAAESGFLQPDSRWAPEREIHSFSPERARTAFDRLGLPPLVLGAAVEDAVDQGLADQIAVALKRAGARARVRRLPRGQLPGALAAGRINGAIELIPALVSYDPDFLRAVFGSRSFPLNHAGYASAGFDRVAEEVAGAPDEQTRRDAVGRELEVLDREAPAIALLFSDVTFGYSRTVHDGWVFVEGKGPLDKLSFLGGTAQSEASLLDAGGGGDGGDGGLPVLGVIAAVLGAVALLLALLAIRRGPR